MPYHTHGNKDVLGLIDDQQRQEDWVSANFVYAGYGSIGLSAPAALPNLGAGWETIPFDTERITPRNVTYDVVNNSLTPAITGMWQLSLYVTLTFAEAQGGRSLDYRLYNVDADIAVRSVAAYVARNTEGYTYAVSTLFNVEPPAIGQTLELQVSGGTDTFTGVSVQNAVWDIVHVASLQ